MTDQYSDNVPADFDAFSAPTARFPSGYDTYPDPTLPFEAVSPETKAVRGTRAWYAGGGKSKVKAGLGILAVMLVAGAGTWAASAAFASPGPSSSSAKAPLFPAPAPSKSAARGARNADKAARVTITQLGIGSFTGTDARGRAVTVVYGDNTKFGTKARPFSAGRLAAGMTVTVLGPRDGNSINATDIGVPATSALPGGSQPSATPGQLNG